MFKILTLNNLSGAGLDRLPRDRYEVASEIRRPDAILLRSFNMHELDLPDTLKAVGRAGAGVNNIPVERLTHRGVAVFNAPGANANAVKELVIAGMLLAARNICRSWAFARGLEGDNAALRRQVEAGKKQFVGFELPGRTLGVIGLGSIGVRVANAAIALGMKVIGYDQDITVQRAWQLSSQVQQGTSVDDLLARSDFVTFHTPLTESTRNMINPERLKIMKDGAVVLNFAREGIVDNAAILEALDTGRVYAYVCDFPHRDLLQHERVIALPHIGASTREAEENCAVTVVDEVRDYLEHGIVRNSVNFPEVVMPRTEGFRLAVVNSNVPNMVGQISTALADSDLNILDMLNKSRGEVAYNLVDVNASIPESTLAEIRSIEGVLAVRALNGG
ncbi:D-3-phosphoglycerate dehydrogenase [bacterium BMS3Bbin12]|nr:D-3-phosphoglycerate dehydrogenase [bacterium BMS3Abin12]GBE48180.1 D-3-phosphoglycerate dehydrogenase [bacterium BMS3Bbin12]GBE49991.1 D-3-phosphoglycerate dehydrogenase [bacterium BMS3Bbin13]HDK02621.1 3-phosphoglycerate dehydrogenase [Gammaproteobacteria bacterium]